jgi:hypothetical protein
MRSIVNLFVIIVIGVILADLVVHVSGTNTLLSGMGNLWATGVNGMLGNTTGGQAAKGN